MEHPCLGIVLKRAIYERCHQYPYFILVHIVCYTLQSKELVAYFHFISFYFKIISPRYKFSQYTVLQLALQKLLTIKKLYTTKFIIKKHVWNTPQYIYIYIYTYICKDYFSLSLDLKALVEGAI